MAEFLHFVNVDEAAAVAVGMWKAVFCTAFQARRAEDEDAVPSTATPPSERHFHSVGEFPACFAVLVLLRVLGTKMWTSKKPPQNDDFYRFLFRAGLRHVEARLKYLYSGDANLHLSFAEDRTVNVTLTLPALNSDPVRVKGRHNLTAPGERMPYASPHR